MKLIKLIVLKIIFIFYLLITGNSFADNHNIYETLEIIKKDLKTLERAVYSGSIEMENKKIVSSQLEMDPNSEDVLTRHLLKLSEVEGQFRELTNKFEEINFKLDKLSNRLSKIQADNQVRFQDIETSLTLGVANDSSPKLSLKPEVDENKILPGSSQPQDLGKISYKDTQTSDTSQQIQSVDTTATIVTENYQSEDKILPQDLSLEKQYEFATSFLKVGDYSTAERAFREFVLSNTDHELAGSAQYWYAETFRIRQLYTDAASAYLEGYQKYPKGKKAPINLLKLGVSMVQIGEKDQGCKMINGVELQYPNANQSVIQKAKYESKKFENIFKLNQDFIVGVSGGPDSLALCFLTKIYSIKNSLNAYYFIVDHKLRKNSSAEAQSVKNLLKKHNIKSDILKWHGKKPISNIQSLARNKRYTLLINEAKKLNINNILTGHHIEDLYENFFIRISRGSGLNGLVSFSEKTQIERINIIRPLIYFEKKILNYVTTKVFNCYIDDPSNKKNEFKRVRIRKFIKNLQKDGLDKNKFLSTIKNLKDSDKTIRFYVMKNLKDNSFINKDESKAILNKEFFNQPHEVVFRSFTQIIKFVGNKYYPVRGKKVDTVIDKLIGKNKYSFKLTLGNCIISKTNNTTSIVKER